jgi:hypothetical protein
MAPSFLVWLTTVVFHIACLGGGWAASAGGKPAHNSAGSGGKTMGGGWAVSGHKPAQFLKCSKAPWSHDT